MQVVGTDVGVEAAAGPVEELIASLEVSARQGSRVEAANPQAVALEEELLLVAQFAPLLAEG